MVFQGDAGLESRVVDNLDGLSTIAIDTEITIGSARASFKYLTESSRIALSTCQKTAAVMLVKNVGGKGSRAGKIHVKTYVKSALRARSVLLSRAASNNSYARLLGGTIRNCDLSLSFNGNAEKRVWGTIATNFVSGSAERQSIMTARSNLIAALDTALSQWASLWIKVEEALFGDLRGHGKVHLLLELPPGLVNDDTTSDLVRTYPIISSSQLHAFITR
ncbi:hypothetical protein DFH07DRAFT_775917 [Mycena maculata]|uniref:Uncharacterized protein n=1 Tax=Mycena maculata TaxID=230809 RepID=A0AAD7ISU3_9AGAR|nr:hypothetical protein DFH07DRAFT_775917 [Mycena maculata]